MRRFAPALIAILLVVSVLGVAGAATRITNIAPGNGALCQSSWVGPTVTAEGGSINLCATLIPPSTATATQTGTATVVSPTATASPSETATSTATATASVTDTPTMTATLTSLLTATPLATLTAILAPSATATLTSTATPTVASSPIPAAGQPCPSWVHAQYVTTGPDGRTYPTWHPPVDPSTGCFFGHEHGADPRTSLANSTMPAFGYIGGLVGDNEPHTGFKVFVINHGTVVENGTSVNADYRMVFHQGTSGVGRYVTQFHSLQFDYVAQDGSGRFAHMMGMADTGLNSLDGSVCSVPRQGARDFSTLGCADTYEIWTLARLHIVPEDFIGGPPDAFASFDVSPAVFDPITTRNPLDNTSLIYTQTVKPNQAGVPMTVDPLSADAYFQGCRREIYMGGNWFETAQSDWWTDVYGVVHTNTALNVIHQQVSAMFRNPTDADGFKVRQDYCGNGIHAPN